MRAASLEKDDLSVLLELEKMNREEEAWADLVDVLEHKAGLIDEPEDVLAATLEAARMADRQVRDQQRAERLYRQALDLQPASEEAIEGLTVLLRNEKRFSELADLLVSAASNESDPQAAATLWAQVGDIRAEHLGDLEGSNQALQLAVDLDPSNRSNAERLLALYREREQYDKIVELVGRLDEDNWEDEELVNLWLERAQVLHEKMGNKPGAIESYRQALAIDSGQLQAHRALADLFVETEDWQPARETILKVFDLAGEGGRSGCFLCPACGTKRRRGGCGIAHRRGFNLVGEACQAGAGGYPVPGGGGCGSGQRGGRGASGLAATSLRRDGLLAAGDRGNPAPDFVVGIRAEGSHVPGPGGDSGFPPGRLRWSHPVLGAGAGGRFRLSAGPVAVGPPPVRRAALRRSTGTGGAGHLPRPAGRPAST
jgi:tetratricopeptide (TPR) repeat protein